MVLFNLKVLKTVACVAGGIQLFARSQSSGGGAMNASGEDARRMGRSRLAEKQRRHC